MLQRSLMVSRTHDTVLFIFLDGIGVAPAADCNPLAKASMPTLNSLLNGPLCESNQCDMHNLLFKTIDACLGIKGLPQSATGQTSLLTGINAARLIGFHLPAFPNQKLVDVIKKHNIFSKALAAGAKATFANSYSELYFQLVEQRKRRHSVTTHCVFASGLRFRDINDLKKGNAVHWDMTRETLIPYVSEPIPVISHYQAGKDLAGISSRYDLVLYESFLSDVIGHAKSEHKALLFLENLDIFLTGVLDHLSGNCTLLLSSDHGNIEDLSTKQHTRNPVPLIARGKAATAFRTAESITDITPAIIRVLSASQDSS
jgi:2,3-bisphosphoglycerate-independent phosphoglycerate mutase